MIQLEKGQTYQNKQARLWTVKSGQIWITVEGDEQDYVLKAGESFPNQENQRVVLQGLEQALILFDTEVSR